MAAAAESKEEIKGLDDGGSDDILKLVSSEGEAFPVPRKVALQSELVKTMAEGGPCISLSWSCFSEAY